MVDFNFGFGFSLGGPGTIFVDTYFYPYSYDPYYIEASLDPYASTASWAIENENHEIHAIQTDSSGKINDACFEGSKYYNQPIHKYEQDVIEGIEDKTNISIGVSCIK